jgi:ferric-dicitrate binding protein FerR (iron transport regulator)
MGFALILSLFPLQQVAPVWAQTPQLGVAQQAIGTLVVVRPDKIQDRLQGKGALQLFEGDMVTTEETSQALLEIKDGTELALNANTVLQLLYRWEKTRGITYILRLHKGEIWVRTGPGPKLLEVETPVATAAVRETEFNIKVQEDGQTVLTVIQGIVEFGTAFGTCPIRASTMSYGVRGKRCTKPESTNVAPAIAWTADIIKK